MMKKLLLALTLCLSAVSALAKDRIVYTRPDGGVTIVVPTRSFVAKFDTLAEAIAAVQAKSVPPSATDIQIIDSGDVPRNRVFRNAWRQTGGVFSTDMPTARNIHAERIATAQIAESARLDTQERLARLTGRTTDANRHAADKAIVDSLNFATLAAQIATASDEMALLAVWPAQLPR